MYRDPRGGHNQKKFNEHFFKTWSPAMAYILGFICADGAVIDARKSSRTCYTTITICDKDLLERIKKTLASDHKLYTKPAHNNKFGKNTYLCKETYTLRLGSKIMFQDLINLGVTPRKSLRLKLPNIPSQYSKFFVRGYFDGDGCVNVYSRKNFSPIVQTIFTSGCKTFLENLSMLLSNVLRINNQNINYSGGAYRLSYKKRSSIKVLSFIYKDLKLAPFLERKYNIAKVFLT